MSGKVRRLGEKLIDLVVPPRCHFCDAILEVGTRPLICKRCMATLPRRQKCCPKCGGEIEYEDGYPQCYTCQSAGRHYDGAMSAFEYKGLIRQCILKYKFSLREAYASSLAFVPAQDICTFFEGVNVDFLTHVPSHKNKRRKRGFDNAGLLAREISRLTGIPHEEKILVKVRDTKNQSELHRRERAKNVKGAYQVSAKKKVKGKKIILIDDVFTTGFTTMEVARQLKKAGAAYVFVYTVATGSQNGEDG